MGGYNNKGDQNLIFRDYTGSSYYPGSAEARPSEPKAFCQQGR